MRSRTMSAMLSFVLLASPAVARAQNLATSPADRPSPVETSTGWKPADAHITATHSDTTHRGIAGAPMTGLRVGAHHLSSPSATTTTVATPQRAGLGQPAAMMVVGLAGLVAGAIIGGDPGTIIMVGGAVVGLIGLWQYLQ